MNGPTVDQSSPHSQSAESILKAALDYATVRGWFVFPAPPGQKKSYKSAEHSNGNKWGMTKDANGIRQDWKRWPDANVGIVTGQVNGLFVVEADTPQGHGVDGIASLEQLEVKHSKLPDTLMAESPSGSVHYYFKHPGNLKIKNSDSKIAPGVDVRGDGGMVIAPPSIRADGKYRWINNSEIADAPTWLIDLAKEQKRSHDEGPGTDKRSDLPNIDEVRAALAAIPNDENTNWEDWNRIGMAAFVATGGSPEGLSAFAKWSSKNKKYNAANTQEKWNGYFGSPPDSLTGKTLFWEADKADPNWRTTIGHGFSDADLAEIRRLAGLSKVEYDRQRKEAAKRLNMRVSTLDGFVEGLRPRADNETQTRGMPLDLVEPEPWTEPVEGSKLIAEIKETIRKYVALHDHQATAVGLFILHAHASDAAEHFPRLHVASPVPRCGKTTLLDTIKPMVPKPVSTESISTSALFRVIEMAQPTLLIDEVDSFLNDNEDMRGLLNAGHKRGGCAIINVPVGDDWEPRGFRVATSTVIAGIGRISGTLEDRSITINLKRRKREEKIERLRSNRTGHLTELCRKAARWVSDHVVTLGDADPNLPNELNDREQDNWRPLIAIADNISTETGNEAREAAKAISKDNLVEDDGAGTMVLADIVDIFESNNSAELTGVQLVHELVELPDRPWREWRRGQPMTTTSLAKLLKPFGIRPKPVWDGHLKKTVKKYQAMPIREARDRYVDHHEKATDAEEEPF
jgi:putative DNA primase/helicase